ncbi:4-alpha-glucanotransferase [Nocardioides pocheonensis]|uniref:4-alpha-glucanotransferase n=1 Tax=Nocardioides pocheonensis TaxID=661485 RepID=A0A3N0GHP1_9ACTN|nr:4-alpha-glucanotransferase [Nocardioides pocheonensis]RNM11668.1 4-alpha-glucanotransferase [Nocardioides pocheonensis]
MDPSTPVAPLDTRRAGVLLHVTSLPGASGPGDLGEAAYRFVDFLADAGCTVWQVLPLVPTHEEDGSPYNARSAMAGNPDLISRERQAADGLGDLRALDEEQRAAYETWCAERRDWLEPYVEYIALGELVGGTPWPTWEPGVRDRRPDRVAETLAPVAERVEQLRFDQWVFALQWNALHAYAASKGVLLFGDLPIFVSLDSADVWASRALFQLDESGRPTTVTGCPPDYFAADGQRWNNPHYDWDAMATDGFAWWRRRIARQRELFDLVRIDHFRGFEAAWHVPVEAPTARDGAWVRGPGDAVLSALVETAGPGTLVAEDLGQITPEVDQLRLRFGLPGMKILQFAFDGSPDNPYLPAHHGQQSVVYTGTHDNDTTVGWWSELDEGTRGLVRSYLLDPDEPMPWALIRLALASTARLAVVPAQDLLGLGSDCRMNTPGTDEGNWTWRADPGSFDAELAGRLRGLVEAAGRLG